MDTERLVRDKEELLHQVVSLRDEVEKSHGERLELQERVKKLEREREEKEAQYKALLEELKAARATVQARQGECSNWFKSTHSRVASCS